MTYKYTNQNKSEYLQENNPPFLLSKISSYNEFNPSISSDQIHSPSSKKLANGLLGLFRMVLDNPQQKKKKKN